MDPATTSLLAEAGKLGFVVLLLLGAVIGLVKWVRRLEEDRQIREDKSREQCRAEIADLISEVRKIHELRHQDLKELNGRCLDVLQQNSETFRRLVELEKMRTASGPHPTVRA